MDPPRNIHELDNIILLRQALDILAAPEEEQLALYPSELDPPTEMARLYCDAWVLVRPVFWPILTKEARETFDGIDSELSSASPDWEKVRSAAEEAIGHLPGAQESRRPRAWLDQMVQGKNHLQLRRQFVAGEGA